MKLKPAFISSLVGLLLLSFNYNLMAQQEDEKLAVLQKKVDSLSEIVVAQQKEIADLKEELGKLKKGFPFSVKPLDPKSNSNPSGAVPFEFNGQTYYIVPIIEKDDPMIFKKLK